MILYGELIKHIGNAVLRMKSGSDNMFFIPKSASPVNRKVTYANPLCDYRPLKDGPYRIRLVVDGDRLNYDADTGAPTANLLDVKILLNSIISTPGARFASIDIKDFSDALQWPSTSTSKSPSDGSQRKFVYNIICILLSMTMAMSTARRHV